MGQTRKYDGISLQEILVVIAFYLVMAAAYYLTVVLSVRSFVKPGQSIWELEEFRRFLLDYCIKLLLTIPVWWLLFRTLYKVALWKKSLLHLITLPLFVFGWKVINYYVCDKLKIGRLRGDGEVWDVYITFLFYVLQFALLHVHDYNRRLLHQQQLSAELKQLAMDSEMNTLKSQIQPHFLFNTLNSISSALPPREEHTRELIARLADTFRFAMNMAHKPTIHLQEELLFIKNYLSLEQERFSDRLQVIYEIDPGIEKILIPPFLLQPLIENALKHGIGRSEIGGSILLKIIGINNKVYFEVTDTGAGLNGYTMPNLFKKGIGLQNTRQRLLKLFDEDVYISANLPKGTKVHFSIPYCDKP